MYLINYILTMILISTQILQDISNTFTPHVYNTYVNYYNFKNLISIKLSEQLKK